MDGIVHATFVDLKDESLLSPDTSEFVTLERQILEQQPNFIIGSETGSATSEAPQSPHSMLLKFRFSEQATRILRNRPILLKVNVKSNGRFLKICFALLRKPELYSYNLSYHSCLRPTHARLAQNLSNHIMFLFLFWSIYFSVLCRSSTSFW